MSQEEYSVKKRAEGRELDSLPIFTCNEMDEIYEMCHGDEMMLNDIARVVDKKPITVDTNGVESGECAKRSVYETHIDCDDVQVQVFQTDVMEVDGLDKTPGGGTWVFRGAHTVVIKIKKYP